MEDSGGSEGGQEMTLGQLVSAALQNAEKAIGADAPSDAKQAQILVSSALSQLALCASLISHLSVLSSNESLDDLTASSLRCILVPVLQGECELQLRTQLHSERREFLVRSQAAFNRFIEQVHDYDIVAREQRKVLAGPSDSIAGGAAGRREAKIAQFKAERELKQRVEALRQRPGRTGVNEKEAGDEEEAERDLTLAEIRLHYVQAHSQLSSIHQELELLAGMPSQDAPAAADREPSEEDLSWRLDRISNGLPTSGPILSAQGRVLRPFTILPSAVNSMDARIRLQNQVFGPSHRLPTMTVDEYLEQEAARGNILTGGGAAGEARQEAEKADQLARREGDNLEAEILEEEERRKALEWDEYRDAHRRGEGNMLGRG